MFANAATPRTPVQLGVGKIGTSRHGLLVESLVGENEEKRALTQRLQHSTLEWTKSTSAQVST
jgi:hypothetical protein